MAFKPIEPLKFDELDFDIKNPRLIELGLKPSETQENILIQLCKVMAVDEIILSILNSGFFTNEPLIAIKNGKRYTIIEGNRRLAAVKVIRNHIKYKEFYPSHVKAPNKSLIDDLEELPAIVVDSREDAWQYIGFKHVNGAAKWSSYAKAEYIAHIHNDFHIPLDKIALQIGDTNKTVERLYQALMVIEQAEKKKIFDRSDINAPRLYFSHLYTALQYDGIQKYLKIKEITIDTKEPVSPERIDNLKELLEWIFGSVKNEAKPIIQSQNPDIRNLNEVIQSKQALSALRERRDLSLAYDLSLPDDYQFSESLNEAKRALYKSLKYWVTGYKGDEENLRLAGTIANMADDLYNSMEKKQTNSATKGNKKRVSE